MIAKNYSTIAYFTFMITIVYAVLLMVWPLSLAQADAGGPPLPPRNPPPVTPAISGDDGKDDRDPLPGAYIELQTPIAPVEAWTIAQWQDRSGDWHEVEGWQGALESDGSKRWWVAAKDFGKGPFRWVVMDRKGGQLLATSASFNLPGQSYEIIQIKVSLGQ